MQQERKTSEFFLNQKLIAKFTGLVFLATLPAYIISTCKEARSYNPKDIPDNIVTYNTQKINQ